MTYEEIEKNAPEEFAERAANKFVSLGEVKTHNKS
jgi:hypothetical protein